MSQQPDQFKRLYDLEVEIADRAASSTLVLKTCVDSCRKAKEELKLKLIPEIMSESSQPDQTKEWLDKIMQKVDQMESDIMSAWTNSSQNDSRVSEAMRIRREEAIRAGEENRWLTWTINMMREMLSAICTKQALSGSVSFSGGGNWPTLNKDGYSSGYNGNASVSGNGSVSEMETRPNIGSDPSNFRGKPIG